MRQSYEVEGALGPAIPSPAARRTRYAAVASELALLGDAQLAELVAAAPVVSSGIGGCVSRLDVAGVPVFVKRVPLTELERQPEHLRSTANLFGLPAFYQYGIGSAGFGVWRDLAVHLTTTHWVLADECAGFPLLYHWRMLDSPPPSNYIPAEEAGSLEQYVAYWDGAAAVRHRMEAIAAAPASVVLFCEHFPHSLSEWLHIQAEAGPEAIDAACAMVHQQLRQVVPWLNSRGVWHFDAHLDNVLTDGQQLYLTDFGLATSPRFALSEEERTFLRANADLDQAYSVSALVNWLVGTLNDTSTMDEHRALVRRYASGETPESMPPTAAALVTRYAPVATVLSDFYDRLRRGAKTIPFPGEELARACARADLPVDASSALLET